MQNEQSTTLTKIIEVSLKEFSLKGFRGTSLREIVKKAGVTTGAFYGYFKSKEDLFDFLVKEHADYIKGIYDQVYSDFSKLSLEEQINQMEDYSSVGLKHMFSYTWNHKKVFNLILNCADGTSYQNFLNEVAQREIVATEKFYDILKSQGIKCENLDPLMEEIIIKGTFSSLFTLCLLDIPYDQAQKSLDQMFRFYRGGWDSLMHFSKN